MEKGKEDCLTCRYYREATYSSGSTCDRGRYAFPSLIQEMRCKKYLKK